MGLIGRVKQWAKRVAVLDFGGGETARCDHFGAAGDDAPPLPGDHVLAVGVRRRGRRVLIGCWDDVNESVAAPGEKRIYARSTAGSVVAWAWLRGDGTIEWSNGTGSLTMAPDGVVTINGATISVDGKITATEVTAGGIALSAHVHGPGSYATPTGGGAITPGTTSAAPSNPPGGA